MPNIVLYEYGVEYGVDYGVPNHPEQIDCIKFPLKTSATGNTV